jgi:hypothetical protein
MTGATRHLPPLSFTVGRAAAAVAAALSFMAGDPKGFSHRRYPFAPAVGAADPAA